jgi:hypothetical protein
LLARLLAIQGSGTMKRDFITIALFVLGIVSVGLPDAAAQSDTFITVSAPTPFARNKQNEPASFTPATTCNAGDDPREFR